MTLFAIEVLERIDDFTYDDRLSKINDEDESLSVSALKKLYIINPKKAQTEAKKYRILMQ